MIESLKYVVSFNTTGRTLKNQLNFKPGLTVIKGENEAGKSFVFEMIRYALFGSAALRGIAEDYEKLDVTLKIWIKGKLYTIHRTLNKAWVNGTEAVGQKASTQCIEKALGFKLSVFDIACNAKQGQLDRLTEDMQPAERRRMIDEVTGLTQFEKAEKDCRDEANSFRRISEAMESQLVEPVAPVKPQDYEPSEVLQKRLEREIAAEAMRYAVMAVKEPVKPQEPAGSRDAIQHEIDRTADNKLRASLQAKLASLPEPDCPYNEKTLQSFRLSLVQAARGPRPKMINPVTLEKWRHDSIIRASDEGPVKCPKCGEIISGKELPPLPPMTITEIDAELKAQRVWEGYEYIEGLPQSPLVLDEIDSALATLANLPERRLVLDQISALGPPMEDRSKESQGWKNYEATLEAFDRDERAYKQYLIKQAELDKLPAVEPLLREKLSMATRYETLLARHDAAVDSYEQQQDKIKAAAQKREGFKRGAEALKDARKDVKTYLIPSLAKVSSNLLREMTDGERKVIRIDEDFEIYVDNQHVRTLSGSGISVVNLALRIALGQVLTQSVVPVFLADEIDANMAAKRTKATHDSLKRLKSRVKQIIVITHKEFEGDHSICLT